jgi:hypothetical protein
VLQFDLCDRRILAIKSNGLIILDFETGHAPKIRTIGYSQIWKKQQHRKAQEDAYPLHHRGSPFYGNCQLNPLWSEAAPYRKRRFMTMSIIPLPEGAHEEKGCF